MQNHSTAVQRVPWTNIDTKLILYQVKGQRKEGFVCEPNIWDHSSSVMAWVCKAASGTASLIFIKDITHYGRSRMKLKVYREIHPMYHTASQWPKDTTKCVHMWKRWKDLDWRRQSGDLDQNEHDMMEETP